MPRKKGKSISFDAMVKFFLHTYEIPTKRDVEKLIARLDRLETLMTAPAPAPGAPQGRAGGATAPSRPRTRCSTPSNAPSRV